MDSGNDKPIHFDSKTLVSILWVILFVVLLLPVVWVIYRVAKDLRIEHQQRRAAREKAADLERGKSRPSSSTAELDDGGAGACELEQPPLPELQGVGVLEVWGDACAAEVCGRGVVRELEGDGGRVGEGLEKVRVGGNGAGLMVLEIRIPEGIAELEGQNQGEVKVEKEKVEKEKVEKETDWGKES